MNTTKNKSNDKFAAEVKRRNRLFKNATPAQKRVLIAKDVLEQIKKKKIAPSNSVFMNISRDIFNNLNYKDSFQKVLIENTVPTCECCAQGALFVSCTLFNNQTKMYDILSYKNGYDSIGMQIEENDKIPNGLNKIFSKNQLILIEIAFESGKGYFYKDCDGFGNIPKSISESKYRKAVNFFKDNVYSKDRMIAIMKNIIKNNGEFIP